MMALEANGILYEGFTSGNITASMHDLCYEFNFTFVNLKNLYTPIKIGDSVKIYVNNRVILTGYVETIQASYDENNHNIAITGRSKTCDIVDSSIGDELTFSGGISLINLIKQTLSKMNITDIDVMSDVILENFKKDEIAHSEVCETIFTFLSKYAKKRQVFLTTNGNGDIIITRTSSNIIKTILTSSYNVKSTILSANLSIDNLQRFYKYILNTQSNPSSLGDEDFDETQEVNKDTWKQFRDIKDKQCNIAAIAYDNEIRHSRTLNFQVDAPHNDKTTTPTSTWEQFKSSKTQKSLKDADKTAIWESNLRRAKALKYTCVVQGFSPIDDKYIIWKPNLLVKVIDEILNVNAQLLVSSVSFDYGLDTGSRTTLELVDPQVYTLELLEGIKEQKTKGGKIEGYKFQK